MPGADAAGCAAMLGTPAQRRGAAAHALLSAGARGGAGGAEWAAVRARGTVRIRIDGAWRSDVACPAAEWGSAAALVRWVLRFLAGCDGGPEGFALVAGALPVPGPAGGADVDAAGEHWGRRGKLLKAAYELLMGRARW